MAKINLPGGGLEKEAFKTLPAKEKEEYISNLLSKILEINPDGVTISQIREYTGLTYSTIWHHLEILSCVSLARKISRGILDVYYPSGKSTIIKEYLHAKDDARYIISSEENIDGKYICIHEKRQNKLGNYKVCRGVGIPIELIGSIIPELARIRIPSKKEDKIGK